MRHLLHAAFTGVVAASTGCTPAPAPTSEPTRTPSQSRAPATPPPLAAPSLGPDDFVFTDPAAWRPLADRASGSLELHGASRYRPPHRSPLNIALLATHSYGDFVLDADIRQTGREYGHRDMCVFFGFQDPAHFYYVHIASVTDDHAHNIFIVNDAARTKISTTTTDGVDWGPGDDGNDWHHVRVERSVEHGTIRVFFDDMDEPIMLANDGTFGRGYIGFGSFDDTGQIDNIRIAGAAHPGRTVHFESSGSDP